MSAQGFPNTSSHSNTQRASPTCLRGKSEMTLFTKPDSRAKCLISEASSNPTFSIVSGTFGICLIQVLCKVRVLCAPSLRQAGVSDRCLCYAFIVVRRIELLLFDVCIDPMAPVLTNYQNRDDLIELAGPDDTHATHIHVRGISRCPCGCRTGLLKENILHWKKRLILVSRAYK